MRYLKTIVDFEHPNPEFAADLIAVQFYRIGLKGVVIEDPALTHVDGSSAGPTSPTSPQSAVIGYIPSDARAEGHLDFLRRRLADLQAQYQIHWHLQCEPVAEEDWAESWKAFFHRQKIGTRIVVQPSWQTDAAPGDDDLVITLDPGQAFGTGTHPTTALCMRMLEKYLPAGSSLLDIGTGSGILMITGAKLGAGKVWGVDTDPVAIESAARNLARNGLDPRGWRLIQGHLTSAVDETFDFVVANILSDTIIELTDTLDRVLVRNGLFVASGIYEDRRSEVTARMVDRGLAVTDIQRQDQWACIAAKRCE